MELGASGLLNAEVLIGASIALALLAALLFMRDGERRRRLAILGLYDVVSRVGTIFLWLMVPALLIVAVSRPYLGFEDTEISIAGDDYMFVADVSRSMLARDMQPTRLEVMKRKLKTLVSEMSRAGVSNRVGITIFAGDAFIFCPLTSDFAVVKQFLDTLSSEMVTGVGSNLEAGIRVAVDRFAKSRTKSGRIVVASDGEDNALALQQVTSFISSADVRVDVLGIGTTEGSPVDLGSGRFLRDRSGTVVISRLNESSLQQIAAVSGGVYVRNRLDDSDVRALVDAGWGFGKGDGAASKRRLRTYNELGPWIALMALLMMMFIFGESRWSLILRTLVCVSMTASIASAQEPESTAPPSADARQAFELYHRGDFSDSARTFANALLNDPENRSIKQGLASALFKSGRVAEAERMFRDLAATAQTGREYFENAYNQGNALLALGKYQQAIKAFDNALNVKTDDNRALHNRGVAQALLDAQNRNTPTPTPTVAPSPNRQEPAKATPPPTATPAPSAPATQSPATPSPTPGESPVPSPTAQRQDDSKEADASPTPGAEPSTTPDPAATGPNSTSTASAESSPPESTSIPEDQGGRNTAEQSETPEHSTLSGESDSDQKARDDDQERLREAREDMSVVPTPLSESGARNQQDTGGERKPLSVVEAESWLESLPESPLLVMKRRGSASKSGQSW